MMNWTCSPRENPFVHLKTSKIQKYVLGNSYILNKRVLYVAPCKNQYALDMHV
jgi:hypothetical protein